MIAANLAVETFEAADWPRVCAIYLEGILSGNATFETEPPSWDQWDRSHLSAGRLAARVDDVMVGWAALTPVSVRQCYAGVAEASIYVAASARGQGIGRALLKELIRVSEANGIWTLQGSVFPENVASLRLCTANGFRQVGPRKHIGRLNGLWRDTILLERRSDRVGV
jgi:L-amino acid N-acyltransferase YncA